MSAKFIPPTKWKTLYGRVKRYRETTLAGKTPVDTIGCHQLYDKNSRYVPIAAKRFHMLLALMLSAQTRDETTAKVMGVLINNKQCHYIDTIRFPRAVDKYAFLKKLNTKARGAKNKVRVADEVNKYVDSFLTPESVATMSAAQLDSIIFPVSFHNNKTRYIQQTSEIIIEKYDSAVPPDYQTLIKEFPGVGPKMANLFLQEAYDDVTCGIGVDTHVHRISQRFGWTLTSNPVYAHNNDHWKENQTNLAANSKADSHISSSSSASHRKGQKGEKSDISDAVITLKKNYGPEDTRMCLQSWMPRPLWREVNVLLVGLGQTICRPTFPLCHECELNDVCPNAFKESNTKKAPSASVSPRASRSPSPVARGTADHKNNHNDRSGSGSGRGRKRAVADIEDIFGTLIYVKKEKTSVGAKRSRSASSANEEKKASPTKRRKTS